MKYHAVSRVEGVNLSQIATRRAQTLTKGRGVRLKQPAKLSRVKMSAKNSTQPSPRRASRIRSRSPRHGGREGLLRAARHLFALRGLSGTSIRDIAKEAKTNSSQISYYFKNKEGLYRACLVDIATNRLEVANQILIPPRSREEYLVRLRMFAENLINYFSEDRDTGLIIIREYDRLHSPAEDVFRTYFSSLFDLLIEFFRVAQKNRLTRLSASEPLTIASLFFSMLTNELRIDHLRERLYRRTLRDQAYRMALIDQIVEMMS